jgi:hypothetical protein
MIAVDIILGIAWFESSLENICEFLLTATISKMNATMKQMNILCKPKIAEMQVNILVFSVFMRKLAGLSTGAALGPVFAVCPKTPVSEEKGSWKVFKIN